MASVTSELPRTINLNELENGPCTIEVEASGDELSKIAERLSVDTLSSLKGTISLEIPEHPHPMFDGTVVNAEGRLTAILTQTCVITLDKFETTTESEFKGVLSNDDPAAEMAEDDDEGRAALPDVLGEIDGETVRIGDVFIEQLALEIDPFPRKPGSDFSGFSTGSAEMDDDGRKSPFAVLEKLKDNLE